MLNPLNNEPLPAECFKCLFDFEKNISGNCEQKLKIDIIIQDLCLQFKRIDSVIVPTHCEQCKPHYALIQINHLESQWLICSPYQTLPYCTRHLTKTSDGTPSPTPTCLECSENVLLNGKCQLLHCLETLDNHLTCNKCENEYLL